MYKSIVLVVIFLLVEAGLVSGEALPDESVLTIGRATDNVAKQQKRMEPFITYLASKLNDVNIEQGEVMLPADNKNETIIKYLKEGLLDIVIESPLSAAILKKSGYATPLLLLKGKQKDRFSMFFVRKDSKIEKFDDLRGQVIAFQDRESTSAYLIPRIIMEEQGLELIELSSADDFVPKDKIGYVFAGSELNVSGWVFHKKVAAGAFSNSDWGRKDDNPEAYREAFSIFSETPKLPAGRILLIRKGLDQNLVTRINEEIFKMHQNKNGKKALKKMKGRTKASKIPKVLSDFMTAAIKQL